MQNELVNLLSARRGHFRLESGYHGDLWLNLELLCLRPAAIRPFAVALAERIARHEVDMVCGPLVEGSFVGLMVAAELALEFSYTERFANPSSEEFYPVEYRIPNALREKVSGRRVAIINDVINAGSAVRGTFADLLACGAQPVVIGALLVLGESAASFASAQNVVLESIATLPNALWLPAECPLCVSGVPLNEAA